jgi:hypothetical protein
VLRLSGREFLLAGLGALVAGLLTALVDVAIGAWIGERPVLPQLTIPEWVLHGFFLGALIGPVLLVAEATRAWRGWVRALTLLAVACVLDRLLHLHYVAGWGFQGGGPSPWDKFEFRETVELYLSSPVSSWTWELPVGFALALACWQRERRSLHVVARAALAGLATLAVGIAALTVSHLSEQGPEPGAWYSPPWWEGLSYNWGAAHALSGVWLAGLLPLLLGALEGMLPPGEGEAGPLEDCEKRREVVP